MRLQSNFFSPQLANFAQVLAFGTHYCHFKSLIHALLQDVLFFFFLEATYRAC